MTSQRYLLVAISLSYAAMISLAIAFNIMPVFLTTLSMDLGGGAGLTNEQLGRICAVLSAGLVVGILTTGPLADRMGGKRFAVGGNLLVAAGLVVLSMSPSYHAVLGAVFIIGFGAGTLDMVLSPIVAALQPHRRTAAMNLLHAFYCIGAVLTILIASVSLKLDVPWRSIALGLAAMPLAVAAGFAMIPIPPLVAGGQERTPSRLLARNPYFILAMVAIFLGGATEVGMANWLPTYAEKSLGYTRWVGGMAFLGFSLSMAVGRLAAGFVAHRLSPITLMTWCCWASVGLFLIACFAPLPPVALAACVAAGLTGSCLWPSILGVAADRFPHGGASMFAALSAMGNFGGIFMPWIVGLTADHSTMALGLATSTFCPLLLALLLPRLRK